MSSNNKKASYDEAAKAVGLSVRTLRRYVHLDRVRSYTFAHGAQLRREFDLDELAEDIAKIGSEATS